MNLNFLEAVAKHFNYNKNKIDQYISIKDWIRLHKDYWDKPPQDFENIDSYDEKFKKLINQYLN